MAINIQRFKAVANEAKARTTDKRWQNAIDKAVAGVESGWWIITELSDGVMVTTESGATYHANGVCSCRAFELGQPCKHRALARLLDLYNETRRANSPRITRSIEPGVSANTIGSQR
jgi:SWIM zinc finger